ncbi:sigma 54-interacting transcriptional regulator [Anaerovorax odorimutans]|uniref:HTH-type transcriptional regulatory protein TyrR n=1 Tax=Anaerovorax odorimutans TaxID=109327 RepID=A0ABT1RKU3_9FIRM|nr:sigma 54-interacting transcriptional regulator [Anaerovorax odorimutans]MCQ4635795.1 sigma 54-interacting transcriptional regulator [Anaerovorax odorimutans]
MKNNIPLNNDEIQALKNSVDFEDICNHLIDSIYITDGQGTTLYVNQKYLDLGNLKPEEIVGRNIFDINEEEDIYTNGVLPTVLKTKQTAETIGTLTRTNKKLYVTGIPILDEEGNIKYAIAHQKDIERLEELRENLATLRVAYNQESAELEYLRQKQMNDINIIVESDNMKEAFSTISAIADTDVTVLITGESGTGKEVLADAIYKNSTRNGQPFIKINCSAIPANLLESELFGYEPGSFTGANQKGKTGLIEIANDGVLLLDEIGDMPLELQAKMLRVLQERQITKIGGKAPIDLNVRFIAATNKDLKKEIEKGHFREDLYYRLNVVPIHLEPLRKRSEDLGPLMDGLLKKYNTKYNKDIIMTMGASQLLHEYEWPGNIRELKNIIERMVVVNKTGVIDVALVSSVLNIKHTFTSADSFSLKGAVEDLEKRMILKAIEMNGSKRKAATALGVDHSTLIKKCQRYGI